MTQPRTVRYGADPSQFAELWLPSGTPRGVVVVIHGGFWRARYDLDLGRPLAASLVAHGRAGRLLEPHPCGLGVWEGRRAGMCPHGVTERSVHFGQEAAGGLVERESSVLPGRVLTESRQPLHVAPDRAGIRLVLVRQCVRLRGLLAR